MDSLIRLRQLNNPEISGYVVDILNQYLTGTATIQVSTGALTGAFYPLRRNPSGYITGFDSGLFVLKTQTGDFLTFTDTRYITSILNVTDARYFPLASGFSGGLSGAFYPLSNPSGFITYDQAINLFQTGSGNSGGVTGDFVSQHDTRLIFLDGNLFTPSIDGQNSILWNTGLSSVSVDWYNEQLFDAGDLTLDWRAKSLVGGWAMDGFSLLTTNDTGVLAPEHLGLPTDGAYGTVAGILQGDRHEDAFDKIDSILSKLAPSRPLSLSQSTFSFVNTTFGNMFEQGTSGNVLSNVINISAGMPQARATGFSDGDIGILSGFVNGTLTGQRALTTGNDAGTYTGLVINTDADFYSGQVGKAGFWTYLTASILPLGTTFPTGRLTMQLTHSTQGSTPILSGFVDRPLTPTASVLSIVTGASTINTLDGVPALASGSAINVTCQINNTVSASYRSTTIAQLNSSQTSFTTMNPTGAPKSGAILVLSGNLFVNGSAFTTGFVANAVSTNSANVNSVTASSQSSIRIDTSSQPTSRKKSGSGQFPLDANYGGIYDNAVLTGTANEELQLINGTIQFPPAINYTSIIPSGPNYIGIAGGIYNGYRWATFNVGTISDVPSILLTISGANNFTLSGVSPAVVTSLALFCKVTGSNGTNGWIDGNSAFIVGTIPTNNGQPALDLSDSQTSASVKRITFGTVCNGTVFVRIGFPSGNKSFNGIGMS